MISTLKYISKSINGSILVSTTLEEQAHNGIQKLLKKYSYTSIKTKGSQNNK